ncbi:MAG: hypothetical protein U0575_10920 [Phycisphaerales bacterium]
MRPEAIRSGGLWTEGPRTESTRPLDDRAKGLQPSDLHASDQGSSQPTTGAVATAVRAGAARAATRRRRIERRRRAAIGAGIVGLAIAGAAAISATAPAGLLLNEIRADQPGTDNDEYFELLGDPSLSLDGVTLIVIGDGVGGSGGIEEIVHLDGHALRPDGFFLVAQPQMTLAVPDLVTPLEFENSDNLTFMLVTGFTGTMGQDLDIDDDGVLDIAPWSAMLDAVAIVESTQVPPTTTEWWYAKSVGPGGNGDPPFLIYRCAETGEWLMGPNDPAAGVDTPGGTNHGCIPPPTACAADINGDTIVDGIDLSIVLLNWGEFGDPDEGGGNRAADLNGDGVVDGGGVGLLLLAGTNADRRSGATRSVRVDRDGDLE